MSEIPRGLSGQPMVGDQHPPTDASAPGGGPLGADPWPPATSRLLWVPVVGLVLAVALVGGAGFLLIGRDDEPRVETSPTTTAGDGQRTASDPDRGPAGGRSDDGPEETVDAFIRAAGARDCEALLAYVTDDFLGELQGDPTFCATEGAGGFAAAVLDDLERIGDADVDGDRATVRTARPALAYEMDFGLVQEGGAWLIDQLESGTSGGGTTGYD